MANYNDLKTGIDAVIKTNGRQEISGAALNTALNNMITELGAGYQHMGVATPATNPGTPDANVFYLASEAGTYTNFGGIVINEGEVCALVWNGTWTKQVTGAATTAWVNQLGQKVGDILLDLSNASVGKYLADGSANTDSAYNHKEIDATSLRGKVIAYRLGYVLPPDAPLPSDACYLRKTDNSIVALSSYRINADSDIYVVEIPDDASALLISWTVDSRYTTNPFITYNYTTNIISDKLHTDFAAKISDVEEEVGQFGQKVGDVLLDLQNASVGKYLADGSANTDSAYNHKEIDATSLRGKVIAYRLGYVLPPDAPLPSNACYLRKTDNSIVALSSYRINADSDIYVVEIPVDASALLISWTVDSRYTTNPFITYNYTTNIISDTLQKDLAKPGICKEIDVNDYTIIDNSYIKTNGTIEEVSGLGISVIQMNVKKGDCLFVKGQSGATNGIVFIYDSGTGKYIPLSPFELVQVGYDIFYVFFRYFNENTTIFINRWVNNTTKTSIALGNIYENTPTIYQDIKELISKLPTDYGSYVKYIPIGDSITDGTGATPALGSYSKRLNEHFGFNFYYPLAQGGLSVVRQDGQYATYPLLKDKIASSQLNNFKGIISVSVGTNDYGNGHSPLGTFDQIKNVAYANLRPTPSAYDSTYTFAEGFRYDLETLKRNNPNATIIVLSPINRVGEDYEYIQGVTLQSYRDLEKQICELLGIVYVDMRHCGIAKWNTAPVWSADNLHPNDYGYYLMTSFLIPIFEELIESQYYLDTNLN